MFTVLWNTSTPGWQWVVALCGALLAAAFDVRTRRIPNQLTGWLLLLGAIAVGSSRGLAGLESGIVGCLIMALPFVLLFVFAGGGAADAKLMGAIGMWIGAKNGLIAVVAVLLVGAVLGLLYAFAKRRLQTVFVNLSLAGFGLARLLSRQNKWSQAADVMPGEKDMLVMPYGVSIFAGVALAAWTVLIGNSGWIR